MTTPTSVSSSGTAKRPRAMAATRVRGEAGFGLIELLIAMTVMVIGISAIVAGFSSSILALGRASHVATAGTLADKQMEAYRALGYSKIKLNTGLAATADS